jgi:VWFA-related protein
MKVRCAVVAMLAVALAWAGDDDPVVFRSDVSLVRIDVRVRDRENHPANDLKRDDFLLLDNGQRQQIRQFTSEQMPLDVLFLIDVSRSMRPHVETLVKAARKALDTLRADDRVGIMVFDVDTRLRLSLTADPSKHEDDFKGVLKHEKFGDGTRITSSLINAARYMQDEGRREARRAIVILTDDITEDGRDEERVEKALNEADTVLSALIAPNAMPGRMGGHPGRGGMGGPGRGGVSVGVPGIILGRPRYPGQYPGGGGQYPQAGQYPQGGGQYPQQGGGREHESAGAADIARDSGGDSGSINDSKALESTLEGLRQRYSLYFTVPPGAKAGEQRNVTVELAPAARARYEGSDVRFRSAYRPPRDGAAVAAGAEQKEEPAVVESGTSRPTLRRQTGESYGSRQGPNPALSGKTTSTTPAPAAETKPATTTTQPAATTKSGGWRKATDADKAPSEADPLPPPAPKEPTKPE